MARSKKNRPERESRKHESARETEADRNLVLTHSEAVAASPEDCSVAGEEDAGIGLEFMVRESGRTHRTEEPVSSRTKS